MLVCAGCGNRPGPDTGLAIDASTDWRGDRLVILTEVDFEPSAAMVEALERGVDLRVDVVTRVSRRIGPVALMTDKQRHPMRIRFLPLTEQWQLDTEDGQQTFPRRWLLLEALAQTRIIETEMTRARADEGRWQIQVRAEFNRGELPPPMHLPSLFSAQWRMKSPWRTWRIEAS